MYLKITLIFLLSYLIFPVTSQKTETVKVGLLIQDKASLAAKQGAELAVKMANNRGGINGCQIQLLTKDMEGPWGTGSKQAIKLVFEDKVWALLGSHDGRNAHLVEQAATKSTVVLVSAWSSDPTLSQAFVPWFFNCVPNDRQQANAMTEEIYNKRKLSRVAAIIDDTYESKMAFKYFLQSIKSTGKKEPVQLLFDNYASKLNALADQINRTNIDCIVILCCPKASLELIRQIKQRKMSQPVFGSLSILDENKLSEQEMQEFDNLLLIPSGIWSKSKFLAFRQEYQNEYGEMPGMIAAYAFDGMNVLIKAIRTAREPEREKIQQSLSKIQYEGVTGLIQFDDKGNRSVNYHLTAIKRGYPVTVQ
jgi:branched-chain amino acid transport system substrate-binding protein